MKRPGPNPPLDSAGVQIVMVGAAHGMDTAQYTVPYVSAWAARVDGNNPVEVVQATGERVRKTALSILDQLDTVQVGSGDPPGLDRDVARRESPSRGRAPERQARPSVERDARMPVPAGRGL